MFPMVFFYINGSEVRRQSVTSDFSTSSNKVSIGGGDGRFFDGILDDFRIYDVALSAAEVQQLYELGQ